MQMVSSESSLDGSRLILTHPISKATASNDFQQDDIGRRIYIGGFSKCFTVENIKALFSGFVKVRDVKLNFDRQTGVSRGSGFLLLESKADAIFLASLQIKELNGHRIIALSCQKKFYNIRKVNRSAPRLSFLARDNESGNFRSEPSLGHPRSLYPFSHLIQAPLNHDSGNIRLNLQVKSNMLPSSEFNNHAPVLKPFGASELMLVPTEASNPAGQNSQSCINSSFGNKHFK